MAEGTSTTTVPSQVWVGPFGSGGTVTGYATQRWASMRVAFESHFAQNVERGAQLVVYEDGEKVVDLSGCNDQSQGYTAGTIQNVFSCGKILEVIAIAMLVDRGLVAYSDLVGKHWPEFACNGKEDVTIADVLRDEAGLAVFCDPGDPTNQEKDTTLSVEDCTNARLLDEVIANAGSTREQYGRRTYHAFSRGWILDAILRRADPQHRGFQQFLKEEVSDKLGVPAFCGIPQDKQPNHDIAPVRQMSMGYNLAWNIVPALMGMGSSTLRHVLVNSKKAGSVMKRPIINWLGVPASPKAFETPAVRALATSSIGCMANARALAKINACIANGGSFEGVRLMSGEAATNIHKNVEVATDSFFDGETGVSQGGLVRFNSARGGMMESSVLSTVPDDLFGWGGWGGSLSFWSLDRNIAFAYVMTGMGNDVLGGGRAANFCKCLVDVIASDSAAAQSEARAPKRHKRIIDDGGDV